MDLTGFDRDAQKRIMDMLMELHDCEIIKIVNTLISPINRAYLDVDKEPAHNMLSLMNKKSYIKVIRVIEKELEFKKDKAQTIYDSL